MNPQDKENRRKALESAKDKLNKRRKAREELKKLKELRVINKDDYGKQLVAQAQGLTQQLNQETKASKEEEEKGSGNGGASVDVPGPRVELSIVNEVNSFDFNRRELVEYAKEIQTDSFDIAQNANIITDENISEKEITKIMATFYDSKIKPWPPSDELNEDDNGDNDGTGDGDNEDNVLEMKEELKMEEESFVMAEDKAIELMSEKTFGHSFGIKSYFLESLISTNEEHSIFYEVDAIDKENETESQMERLTLKGKLSLSGMKGRSITNLHMSPTNPNLLLASHSSLGLLNGYFLDASGAAAANAGNEQSGLSSMFDDSFDGTEGIINVWNIESSQELSNKPTYELICQSMVTTAKFHPTNGNLVIAATVSGQVLGWDMRAKKTPIMRTQFSSGHNAPVFSMGFLSKTDEHMNDNKDDSMNDDNNNEELSLSKQARHIITVSNDGRVCVWRDDFLVNPLSEFVLKLNTNESGDSAGGNNVASGIGGRGIGGGGGTSDDLSTTCFSSLSKDGNVIVFGSDDGCLYKSNEMMNDSMLTGARSVIDTMNATSGTHGAGGHGAGGTGNSQAYDLMVDGTNNYISEDSKNTGKKFAHFGPVTNISFLPHFSQYSINHECPNLYLTSSFDWTVKLWHNKHKKPIATFGQMADYVYDVKWSPARPSVFVCGDGLGKLTMFDLLNDFDSPIAIESTNEENSKKQIAITRIEWQRDGKCLFVGDSNGDISIYDVSPSLYETREEDFERFERILKKKIYH